MPRKPVFAYSTIQKVARIKSGLPHCPMIQDNSKPLLDKQKFGIELMNIRDKKARLILDISREKITREGWQQFSLRGLNRILKSHNLFYENYFTNKMELGLCLAENEFYQLTKNLTRIQKQHPDLLPSQIIADYSQVLITWSKYNQNILDVILSQEVIETYAQIKQETGFTLFVQSMYSLFYRYFNEEKYGTGSDPYELLQVWFYFFFGLTRGQMFPLVEQLSSFRGETISNQLGITTLMNRIISK